MTECNEEPTQDWQRRWNIGMILRHNASHPDDPTPLPLWITESPDNYATSKRPLPETKTDRIYIYMTQITAVIQGTTLTFMTQINSPSKYRYPTPKHNLQKLQPYHHRHHQF